MQFKDKCVLGFRYWTLKTVSGVIKVTSSWWPLLYGHLSNTGTKLCPFGVHIREVQLYLLKAFDLLLTFCSSAKLGDKIYVSWRKQSCLWWKSVEGQTEKYLPWKHAQGVQTNYSKHLNAMTKGKIFSCSAQSTTQSVFTIQLFFRLNHNLTRK